MKKFIAILALVLLTGAAFAQSYTKSTVNFKVEDTYYKYTGTARDTINEKMDTIRIPFYVNKDYPVLIYTNSVFNKIAGIDTTVIVHIYGKVFDNQAWTLISAATATSAVVNTNTAVVSSLLTEPSYTGTIVYDTTKQTGADALYSAATTSGKTAIANYYRYYMIEYITSGNDAVGVGSKLTTLEVKLFRRYF